MSLSDESLQKLYRKVVAKEDLGKTDYAALTCCFTPDHAIPSSKSQSFLILSMICDQYRRPSASTSDSEDDAGTRAILRNFQGIIEEKLADVLEQPLIEAISFISALFTVDWKAGSAIFVRDGFQESLLDAIDLFPTSQDLLYVVVSVLAIACGYKGCRSAFNSRCTALLRSSAIHKADCRTQATSSLALLKLSQGSMSENTSMGLQSASSSDYNNEEDNTFKALRDVVVSSKTPLSDAVEGIAYLSTKARFKEIIIKDDTLIKHLLTFEQFLNVNTQVEIGSTPFGLAAIIANLCAYRPRLSEEDSQIEKLKQMATVRSADRNPTPPVDLDDDEHVRLRGKCLVSVGAVDLLLSIGRTTKSSSTRSFVGKALLGLTEDKDNRGRLLQSGAAKVLLSLINSSQKTKETSNSVRLGKDEYDDLTSIQALAKLSITSSPLQVFGPDENAALDAVRPLVFLLVCPASSLLQKFESMMALTNLSSVGPLLATRIAEAQGLVDKAEFYLLEEHQLIRRASCELICNLVSSTDKVFGLFSGETKEIAGTNRAKSRLQILVALTDVDDEPTRLAASGALAVLTASQKACRFLFLLENENHRAFLILKQLLDLEDDNGNVTNPGIVHRGVVCFRNILLNSEESWRKEVVKEAANRGFVEAFVRIIKAAGQPNVPDAALRPAAEVLKFMADFGVNLEAFDS